VLFPQVTLSVTRDCTRARRLGASSPARTSRWQAVLTAAAFVLSSLFGLIHEATTTHVRCAQHGELIDSDPAVPTAVRTVPAASATSANAEDPDNAAHVRDLPAVAIHDHEHCSLASATRESRLVPRSPALAPTRVATLDLAVAVPRAAATHGRVLYRTAPKTSPPA
jgi:hypothetical protein